MSEIPRAILDSNVIFSRVLHELMGRLAVARMLDLVWSDPLLAETKRVLIEEKPVSEVVAERWIEHMRANFPDGRVDLDEVLETIDVTPDTRDPDDHHVVALAIVGRADYLFTFDRGYLSSPLRTVGVRVSQVDPFLLRRLGADRDAILEIVRTQRAVWGRGNNRCQSCSTPTAARRRPASRKRFEHSALSS